MHVKARRDSPLSAVLCMVRKMANKDELVQACKNVFKLWREQKLDEAYEGFREIFSRPDFAEHRPEDQRSALRLMVLAKGAPQPERATEAMKAAHLAAVPALSNLVSDLGEPGDHEMLGICHVVLGNESTASSIFRAGLAIERSRNPQSDLCGAFMKRISFL
jgi:hypothetical protein